MINLLGESEFRELCSLEKPLFDQLVKDVHQFLLDEGNMGGINYYIDPVRNRMKMDVCVEYLDDPEDGVHMKHDFMDYQISRDRDFTWIRHIEVSFTGVY